MQYVPDHSEEVWLFRKNLRPRFSPADQEFRRVAYITFHYRISGPKKLPTAAEMEMFSDLEEEIINGEGHSFTLVAVATKTGVRDYMFYVSDPKSIQQCASNLMDRFAEYGVQLEVEDDPDWKHYLDFPGGQDVQ